MAAAEIDQFRRERIERTGDRHSADNIPDEELLREALNTVDKAASGAAIRSDTSRPFDRPSTHRIAVKVINHLGDEGMKVFRVDE